jgi:high-affinity K+ transport system ATPase subunit B
MTILREATSSNHNLRPKVLLGMTVMFILVLGVFVTMLLVAAISVG